MTVITEPGPISKWIGIPLIVLGIAGAVGIWFVPWNSSPGLQEFHWMNSLAVRLIARVLAAIAGILFSIGSWAWTFMAGDKNK